MTSINEIHKISDTIWEIPPTYKEGMRVPARIYATEKLLREMDDGVIEQVTNVATLPGIVNYAYCMPDGHWGYGFPIGGVAAMDTRSGVISPGGIGFDVSCGMRLVLTNLTSNVGLKSQMTNIRCFSRRWNGYLSKRMTRMLHQ